MLYVIVIFDEFYFGESEEPRETPVIKFSRKLSILQYISVVNSRRFAVGYKSPVCNTHFLSSFWEMGQEV